MVSDAYNLQRFIEVAESYGLTDVLLPFLLIFTVVFAILQKTKILGEAKKNYNMVVSLAMALIVVIPHVLGVLPVEKDPVAIINTSIPSVAIILIAVVMLLLIVGIFGGESKWTGAMTGWVVVAAIIAVVYIFGSAAGWWQGWDWFEITFGQDAIAIVIILLVFALIIGFITSEPSAEKKVGAMSQIGNLFGELFGKR